MLDRLNPQAKDGILAVIEAFRDDPRPEKIDLGVGVYRNAQGHTPIMRAVKEAERRWWEIEDTKTYLALAGDPGFSSAIRQLVLGSAVPPGNVAVVATPGGTGAVRQAFELARMANPDIRVHVSDPTWPNHLSILRYLGIETLPYRYFDAGTGAVDFDAMMEDLGKVRSGDLILLHGCCHNPTGANLTLPQWHEVIASLNRTGGVPMIDIAYQGFGDGLDEDAAATRAIAAGCPELMIATSCSKNFGIYRERAGALMTVSHAGGQSAIVQANLNHLNRQSYTFPPDHGTRLVSMILEDDALRADWQAELADMRGGLLKLREQLSRELRDRLNSDRFGFVMQHRGMFTRLGLGEAAVQRLRDQHAIYMVGDSRINVAGLTEANVPHVAGAIADVLR